MTDSRCMHPCRSEGCIARSGCNSVEATHPRWPTEWQRHYAALRELVRDEDGPADVLPGVTVHGMDVGKWLARQRQHGVWQALMDGQRELLEAIGVTPPATRAGSASQGPQGGHWRLRAGRTQYKTRTGSVGPISRSPTSKFCQTAPKSSSECS
ncbi:helicase associated domain-containing protein [Streptomyces sp. NPDC087437]|uniref:helicase associated domain-containing protein n=1 Tax=Streptomyces sp. NPDC087437 TaxID=3365789 RepID=UPI0037F69D10